SFPHARKIDRLYVTLGEPGNLGAGASKVVQLGVKLPIGVTKQEINEGEVKLVALAVDRTINPLTNQKYTKEEQAAESAKAFQEHKISETLKKAGIDGIAGTKAVRLIQTKDQGVTTEHVAYVSRLYSGNYEDVVSGK